MKASTNYKKVKETLYKLANAKQDLRELGVIRSERLVGEIGEWFFTAIYGGKRAQSTTQKGWDVKLNGKKIQIKTHAKGDKNNARWTVINFCEDDPDELVIVVFTKEFCLKEFYRVSSKVLVNYIETSGDRKIVYWDKIAKWKIELNKLPKQRVIRLFKNS